jgi:tRNA-dihydrouridine synthase
MLFLILLHAAAGLCAPLSEHHYFHRTSEIQRPTYDVPIKWQGIAIGNTELDPVAANGTIHSLSDGHHFRHRGWYLTDTNGGAWEYLPNLAVLKRSTDAKTDVFHSIEATIDRAMKHYSNKHAVISFEENFSTFLGVDLIEGMKFDRGYISPHHVKGYMDLYDSTSFITSTTSLVGDLKDIFMSALEIFA